ncbi:hypothetical protein F2P81_023609 [Scophthalmus maximus]|uniref:OTU domain-containing protein n=1 Tax=Scophthalmus maximus TaxID=52904 RepID=A0A6A4RWK7_SCOMX|nr:hypothetical protein F2P81_023609 [Scophthalmus maximus]
MEENATELVTDRVIELTRRASWLKLMCSLQKPRQTSASASLVVESEQQQKHHPVMEEGTAETPEELLAKQQRKEKKDLQAKVQSMKNTVPKNDKKRRKQLTEEIAKLEADLTQKQEEELRQLNSSSNNTKVEEVMNGVETMKMEAGEQESEEVLQPRVTKAQKRRDKKAAEEKERESRIAEAEVQNLQGVRHQEGVKLAQKLALQQLQVKEISSDGHCMYRAIEDQLAQRSKPGLTMSVKELRSCTADHMRSHVDDFLPFLTNANTGDMYTTGALRNLVVLNLNHNQIQRLPPETKRLNEEHKVVQNDVFLCYIIVSLRELRRLSALDNKLEELPAELGHLTKLSEISLTSNKLSRLPQQLCQCKDVTELHVARNQLTSLPGVGVRR